MLVGLLSTLALLASASATATAADKPKEGKKPNIVLICEFPTQRTGQVHRRHRDGPLTPDTDDQDVGTMQRHVLPKTFEHLVDKGVSLTNFLCPVSLCCPSRVSLLRSQHAHNHNVTFVSRPWGGWEIFNELGYVGHTMPDFLQQAGYDTYYVGKYM